MIEVANVLEGMADEGAGRNGWTAGRPEEDGADDGFDDGVEPGSRVTT